MAGFPCDGNNPSIPWNCPSLNWYRLCLFACLLLAFAILCPLGRACTRPKRRHKGALYKAQAEAPRALYKAQAKAPSSIVPGPSGGTQPNRALHKAQARAQSSIVQGPSGGVRSLALETVGAVVTATAEVRRITIENVRGRHLKSHAEVATRVSTNQLVHTNHGSTLRFVTEVPALICHVQHRPSAQKGLL